MENGNLTVKYISLDVSLSEFPVIEASFYLYLREFVFRQANQQMIDDTVAADYDCYTVALFKIKKLKQS